MSPAVRSLTDRRDAGFTIIEVLIALVIVAIGIVGIGAVMDALDDRFYLAECTRPNPETLCELVNCCPIRVAINGLHRRLRETLETVTLADLFEPAEESADLQLDLHVPLRAQPAQAVPEGNEELACANDTGPFERNRG